MGLERGKRNTIKEGKKMRRENCVSMNGKKEVRKQGENDKLGHYLLFYM